jgi:hypothetical protein
VLAGFLITSPHGVDVAGDANVIADLLGLLSNTRFAWGTQEAGVIARQSELEGTYAAELRAGQAKNAQGAYAFIHFSRRALFNLLNKAPDTRITRNKEPDTRVNARLFLTADWRRPQPTPSPLPTDHTTDASEICAECTSEDQVTRPEGRQSSRAQRLRTCRRRSSCSTPRADVGALATARRVVEAEEERLRVGGGAERAREQRALLALRA